MTASNSVFDPPKVRQAISYTLEPCQNCQSKQVMALRSEPNRGAVAGCLDCNYIRKLTDAEYRREWPNPA